ncbi:MAG: RidA family protein [Devosia sp.]|jgi:enamine deaminase RidA (YjgF/YER057c/UK114 family)|uniref:RidA family protein n=1 Tax=unclassified Devosia TaxID=196773 RepID=UPI0019DA1AC7|nr:MULTISPECIES: RidA family protein [unclassified Devosia]MBF0680118.1 RidA family protein [Devosia sp.]WEJ32807.1 RidA family protein [Devosia sp. SD17-2]
MASNAPPPQGKYVPAKRHGDLIFVSGMTPRQNGQLIYAGKVSADTDPERLRAATELSTQNVLSAARAILAPGEALVGTLNLTVYVNAEASYTTHPKVADFASAYLEAEFAGDLPSRAAVGVASLPSDASVEVSAVMIVGSAA